MQRGAIAWLLQTGIVGQPHCRPLSTAAQAAAGRMPPAGHDLLSMKAHSQRPSMTTIWLSAMPLYWLQEVSPLLGLQSKDRGA